MELPKLLDLGGVADLAADVIGDSVTAVIALSLAALSVEVFQRWIAGATEVEGTKADILCCPYCEAPRATGSMRKHLIGAHGYTREEADLELSYLLESAGMSSTEARAEIRKARNRR